MFTFAEVLRILLATHGIEDGREKAFRARLKHLQNLGFPAGTNTGKGRRASYGPWQVCQLHIALEFEQLGMTPETIVAIMVGAHDFIACMIGEALAALDVGAPYFLLIDPNALASPNIDWNASYSSLTAATQAQLIGRISNWNEGRGRRRVALIDLASIVLELIHCAAAWSEERSTQFRSALKAWTEELEQRALTKEEDNGNDPQA